MHGVGKVLFVYRDLGDGSIMPVPMTDFSHELHDQKHEFWLLPGDTSEAARFRSEQVAFYRTADTAGTALQMMRIYPIPEEADLVYTIVYAAGALDTSEIALTDTPVMPEWSNLRTLESALYLLPHAAWEGHSMNDNLARRKEIMASLAAQVSDYREEFTAYLANPQHEPMSDVGYWWE
jgi:hypothetical protein